MNSKETVEWLVLVPTSMELSQVESGFLERWRRLGAVVELVGFGPVVAAARTCQLLTKHQPRRVVLMGIAGSYMDEYDIGMALEFTEVALLGIGVGEGSRFQSAEAMGWLQWNGEPEIGDRISLNANGRGLLLTVCSAADSSEMATSRTSRFPQAVAEDMEAFGVASACRLMHRSLHVVRGISNRAGIRDKSQWDVGTAVAAAASLVDALIGPNES